MGEGRGRVAHGDRRPGSAGRGARYSFAGKLRRVLHLGDVRIGIAHPIAYTPLLCEPFEIAVGIAHLFFIPRFVGEPAPVGKPVAIGRSSAKRQSIPRDLPDALDLPQALVLALTESLPVAKPYSASVAEPVSLSEPLATAEQVAISDSVAPLQRLSVLVQQRLTGPRRLFSGRNSRRELANPLLQSPACEPGGGSG